VSIIDIMESFPGAAVREVAPGRMFVIADVPEKPLTLFIYTVDKEVWSDAGGAIGIVAPNVRQAGSILDQVIAGEEGIPQLAGFDCELSFPVSGFQIGLLFMNVYFHREGM
jgi:hypothetical protein